MAKYAESIAFGTSRAIHCHREKRYEEMQNSVRVLVEDSATESRPKLANVSQLQVVRKSTSNVNNCEGVDRMSACDIICTIHIGIMYYVPADE